MGKIVSLQVMDTKHQALLTALLLVAIGLFLLFRHSHHAGASVHNSLPVVNLSVKPDSESSGPSSAPNEATSDSSQPSSSSSTTVTVNGRQINMPQNGTVNQTITDENGTTTINAQHSETSSSTSGQASNSSSSTVNVKVDSNSADSL